MSIATTLDPTDAAILGAVRSRTMVGADRLVDAVPNPPDPADNRAC